MIFFPLDTFIITKLNRGMLVPFFFHTVIQIQSKQNLINFFAEVFLNF